MQISIQQLRNFLDQRYSIEELRDLCFGLEVDPEDIGGRTKGGLIRELILYLRRRNRLNSLLELLREDPDNRLSTHFGTTNLSLAE